MNECITPCADGPAVATIISDVATIMQSFRMELTLEEAKSRMKMSGDQKALGHLLRCIMHKEAHEDANTITPLAASF